MEFGGKWEVTANGVFFRGDKNVLNLSMVMMVA